MSILSFGDSQTQEFFEFGVSLKKTPWRAVAKIALRKLDMLDYATSLNDLKSPPGNRLEPLKGNLKGLFSIRINQKWRIIFRWSPLGPQEVSIVDYHS